MKAGKSFSWILGFVLFLPSIGLLANGSVHFDPDPYISAAVEMGDYLLAVKDGDTLSWAPPWAPDTSDATTTFHVLVSMQKLAEISGEARFAEAVRNSIEWWLDNAFLGDEEEAAGWAWHHAGSVSYIEQWHDWDKVQGGFVSRFWAERDGISDVRDASVFLRDSVALPARVLIGEQPRYSEQLELLKGWFGSDPEHKFPESGSTGYRAFMTAQSFREEDGEFRVDRSYSLWGTRQQSALMNAQALIALFELGLDDKAKLLADWLVQVMRIQPTGNFYQVYSLDRNMPLLGYQSDATFSNGAVAEGLLVAYERTGDESYLNAALEVLNWLIHHEAVLDGNTVYFTDDQVFRTYKVIPAFVMAYRITGESAYLVYAISTADWILGQMTDPFEGFGDNNPWTVAQAIEALTSLPELGR